MSGFYVNLRVATGRARNTLVITTTHLKEGYLRRNGIPFSDQATMTEYWMGHGDYLTVVMIVREDSRNKRGVSR
jgi:hypothetical protein